MLQQAGTLDQKEEVKYSNFPDSLFRVGDYTSTRGFIKRLRNFIGTEKAALLF